MAAVKETAANEWPLSQSLRQSTVDGERRMLGVHYDDAECIAADSNCLSSAHQEVQHHKELLSQTKKKAKALVESVLTERKFIEICVTSFQHSILLCKKATWQSKAMPGNIHNFYYSCG